MSKAYHITPERRAEILAQEVLDAENIQELYGCHINKAYEIIKEIKKRHDRVKISGIVHIQDYLDFFNLPPDRYVMPKHKRSYEIDESEIEKDNVLNALSKIMSQLSDEEVGYIVGEQRKLRQYE